MMVMVSLCAGVLSAFGLKLLFRSSADSRLVAGMLLALLFVEYLPKPIPTSNFAIPEYVQVIKNLPGTQGVLDTVPSMYLTLLYQTLHQKPLAFGYVSRVPQSVVAKDDALAAVIAQEDYAQLWSQYQLRYIVTEDSSHRLRNSPDPKTAVWNDGHVWIFDLSHYTPTLGARPVSR